MADVTKEVKILFNGDDQVSRTIDQLSGKLESFGGQVQSATQPLADMAAVALKAEAALALLATAGLIYAFDASKKFESAALELLKVLGDESNRFDEAKQAAVGLSEQYGESATDIVGSMANWKQAGYDLSDSMLLTKDSMDLVIAGSLEAGEASEYLIGILKGFVAPAGEARHAIDVLNEVSNNYGTNVKELAIGMSSLAPIARLMGMDFEQTAGVLTPVIEIFRSGSEAADALKTALARIVDDRKPTLDTLAALGVTQKDLNGNLRSGYEILLDVARAFETLTPEQQFYHAQNLVGIEQAGRMVSVLSNLDNALEVTRTAYASQGSALKEVEVRLQSADVAVNRFKTGFDNLAVAIGDQFRLAAKDAIDGGTAIEQALKNMVNSGTFDPVLDLVSQFATQLGADLKEIAKILPEAFAGVDWSKLTASIKNVGGEIVDLFEAAFGDVDLTTVEGLQSAIQRVVNGIAALNNVVAGILDSWEPFVRAIADAAQKFSETDESSQQFAGHILGVGQVINEIASRFDVLTAALTGINISLGLLSGTTLINAVGGFGAVGAAVTGLASGLGPLVLVLGTVTAALVSLDSAMSIIDSRWEENRQAISDNIDALHGVDYGLDDISSSADQLANALSNQKTIWQDLSDAIDAMPDEKTIDIEAEARDAEITIDDILKQIQEIPFEKTTDVKAKADEASIQKAKGRIVEEFKDGQLVLVQTDYNEQRLKSTSDAINKAIPPEKEMQIRLQGEIDRELKQIEASAQNIQSFFEYKAKVDVAEVEALFKALETQSTNIKDMFASTGDVLVGLASAFADVGGIARLDIMDLMMEESRRRDELLAEQKKLTDAQVKYLAARSKAMDKGEGIITINANGLAPELELVLQKIIQLTQIRANEEGLAFLLGVR